MKFIRGKLDVRGVRKMLPEVPVILLQGAEPKLVEGTLDVLLAVRCDLNSSSVKMASLIGERVSKVLHCCNPVCKDTRAKWTHIVHN